MSMEKSLSSSDGVYRLPWLDARRGAAAPAVIGSYNIAS